MREMIRAPRRLGVPAFLTMLVAAAVLWPSLSFAQLPGEGVAGRASRRTVAPLPQKPGAPPALPGAQSGGATPSNRVQMDMPPNEALFDGVNRGDIGAVRDALSRGADLNAHNILGITATEMAIDLGRNDIAFLLLSMRNAEKPKRAAKPADPFAAQPEPKGRAQAQARPAPPPKVAAPRMEAPSYPRLYANDGGAPVPSAGFLGFNERSQSR